MPLSISKHPFAEDITSDEELSEVSAMVQGRQDKTERRVRGQSAERTLLQRRGKQVQTSGLTREEVERKSYVGMVSGIGGQLELKDERKLGVEGLADPEPAITVVTQIFPSEPVYPGDSVALQCSLLSDSENKACPAEHNVFWFRAGSDESHPRIIYTHGNRSYGCEKSPEAGSPPQSCVYNFSKNSICSSDAGTYYCAVATCGEILFGNATKLDIEATSRPMSFEDEEKTRHILLSLLSAALVICLIVITFLIYTIKRQTHNWCNGSIPLQTISATTSSDQQSQQRDEDTLVYSSVTFTKREAGNSQTRDAKTAEGETIYADVRAFGWD
ncbi:uncharacterized protein LOC115367010 [Myripristis murdjan]|uniref:uncharacterized protein LOC115367010 n=1 Tax=Myripristis murdjan TaxID=586833 RepID=UPI0011761D0C|nr:uncharacterized protein LOC115367010 [Myripristis murdjan]